MALKNGTPIASLGQFGLIEKLTAPFTPANPSTLRTAGDDAAVVACGKGRLKLLSTDLLLEGVHFDLTYFPLKHLGYKAVVAGVSDIYAMNGLPEQITLAIGVGSRMSVEMLEEFYEGVRQGCADYGVDLAGGDLTTSLTGFTIAVTALGSAEEKKIVTRGGAGVNDLICITGDLGSAYMGLRLLERERRVLEGHNDPQPQFEGYEYLLRRQLKPAARREVVESLAAEKILPTSMIDLTDGLASDLLQICKASGKGAHIYLDRMPIASQTYKLCEEMHSDPVVAALNGGDDFELMFTIPLDLQQKIVDIGGIDVIGHITAPEAGVMLITPDGAQIGITAPGWTALI